MPTPCWGSKWCFLIFSDVTFPTFCSACEVTCFVIGHLIAFVTYFSFNLYFATEQKWIGIIISNSIWCDAEKFTKQLLLYFRRPAETVNTSAKIVSLPLVKSFSVALGHSSVVTSGAIVQKSPSLVAIIIVGHNPTVIRWLTYLPIILIHFSYTQLYRWIIFIPLSKVLSAANRYFPFYLSYSFTTTTRVDISEIKTLLLVKDDATTFLWFGTVQNHPRANQYSHKYTDWRVHSISIGLQDQD